jgi:hypothetical protein
VNRRQTRQRAQQRRKAQHSPSRLVLPESARKQRPHSIMDEAEIIIRLVDELKRLIASCDEAGLDFDAAVASARGQI